MEALSHGGELVSMAPGRAGAAAEITMTAMHIGREVPEKVEDRLIVALDVQAISEARALIDKLEGVVSFFKVGLWLQFAAGLDGLLDYLVGKNKKIFPVLGSMRHHTMIATPAHEISAMGTGSHPVAHVRRAT